MKLRDKYGWPVELIIGRPVKNFIRLLIHTNIRQTLKGLPPMPPSKGCCRTIPCQHPGVGPCDMPAQPRKARGDL